MSNDPGLVIGATLSDSEKCPCGADLPWHLVRIADKRFSHVCRCRNGFSWEDSAMLRYEGKKPSPIADHDEAMAAKAIVAETQKAPQQATTRRAEMRIFAVDISGLFSLYWESNQGKENSRAFNATIRAVNAAREGFDRVAICCDSGISWRRTVWPPYKANRPDRGAAYRHQLQRTIEQLEAEACSVFRAPPMPEHLVDGLACYAEADDVIGTLCAWAIEGGHEVRIYSSDKDLLQLVGHGVEVLNFHGELFNREAVVQKFGIPPERIPDLLALAGDKTDHFKPYPRIGEKRAVDLIKACGSALGIFDVTHWEQVHVYIGKAAAATIKAGGREPAEKCLRIAAVVRDLEMNFDPLLETPKRKPTQPKSDVDFAPSERTPAQEQERTQATAVQPDAVSRRAEPSIERYRLNPIALEPLDAKQAWELAQTVYASTVFKKFPTPEDAFMVILEGRALGIPSIIALKNANIVNGNVGWSARLIRGLAMKSPLCEYFRIIESTKDRAVALCKRVGDPEFRIESNMAQAAERGLIRKPDVREPAGNLWFSDPLVMHLADVERRGARMGWPEVVAGLFTPDELINGVTAEGVRIIESAAG